jgi:hypothetical protein
MRLGTRLKGWVGGISMIRTRANNETHLGRFSVTIFVTTFERSHG